MATSSSSPFCRLMYLASPYLYPLCHHLPLAPFTPNLLKSSAILFYFSLLVSCPRIPVVTLRVVVAGGRLCRCWIPAHRFPEVTTCLRSGVLTPLFPCARIYCCRKKRRRPVGKSEPKCPEDTIFPLIPETLISLFCLSFAFSSVYIVLTTCLHFCVACVCRKEEEEARRRRSRVKVLEH